MLMLIGAYQFLLDSIFSFNLIVLGSASLGGVLGLVICGRLVKHLIDNNETTLYSISMGLIIGSIPVILSEGIPTEGFEILTALIVGVIGFMVVTILNSKKIELND